jgi:hypothetical protein
LLNFAVKRRLACAARGAPRFCIEIVDRIRAGIDQITAGGLKNGEETRVGYGWIDGAKCVADGAV